MTKIKAYTLMEVTVAMLLSAICIGIAYSAYDIIGNYYRTFQQKNEKADALLSIREVLSKDFQKSKLVRSMPDGILLEQDSVNINYVFEADHILRQIPSLRTDTFKVVWKDRYVGFEGNEVLEPDTIDLLKLKVTLDQHSLVPLTFYKHYSAQNLFQ